MQAVVIDLGLTAAVFSTVHVGVAAAVTVHVLLNKRDVGAAVSWIGIAWLSPFLGGLLYVTMGINRVKRRAQRLRRQRLPIATAGEIPADAAGDELLAPLDDADRAWVLGGAATRFYDLPAARGLLP